MLAFGGAGPLNACGVAEKAGIDQVAIPQMAAVFSAYGIGSCDISQRYVVALDGTSVEELRDKMVSLKTKATRDMFAEGCTEGSFTVEVRAIATYEDGRTVTKVLEDNPTYPAAFFEAVSVELEVNAVKSLRSDTSKSASIKAVNPAKASGSRNVLTAKSGRIDVPVYRLADMKAGDYASGPAILEEDYFTCRVLSGWRLVVTEVGDVMLNREG